MIAQSANTVAGYITKSSVCLAVLAFVGGIAIDLIRKKGATLEHHLARVGAAGAIPTAVVLIYGAFEPSIITQLSGLNVPIAAAGLVLLYTSVKTVFASLPSKSEGINREEARGAIPQLLKRGESERKGTA